MANAARVRTAQVGTTAVDELEGDSCFAYLALPRLAAITGMQDCALVACNPN